MLDEVGFYQVVEDVVLTNPLHRTAAGGAKGRTLHPARVAGSTEDMHAGLQAKAKTRNLQNYSLTHTHTHSIGIWWTCKVPYKTTK